MKLKSFMRGVGFTEEELGNIPTIVKNYRYFTLADKKNRPISDKFLVYNPPRTLDTNSKMNFLGLLNNSKPLNISRIILKRNAVVVYCLDHSQLILYFEN